MLKLLFCPPCRTGVRGEPPLKIGVRGGAPGKIFGLKHAISSDFCVPFMCSLCGGLRHTPKTRHFRAPLLHARLAHQSWRVQSPLGTAVRYRVRARACPLHTHALRSPPLSRSARHRPACPSASPTSIRHKLKPAKGVCVWLQYISSSLVARQSTRVLRW